MAAEAVQLGLIALISAPVIHAVFQDTEHTAEEQHARESPAHNSTTTMTDLIAPVHLAAPLALSPHAERTLFTQQALDSHIADVERPTEILQSQTDNTQDRDEQESSDKMGFLNVLTGNISPPADITSPAARDSSNAHGVISNDVQANTHGPSSTHNLIRNDHVEEHYEPTTSERPATTTTTLTEEEKVPRTTLPISAVSEERGEGQHAPLSVHDGIEDGVRAVPAADGTLGDDAPSRSYLKRPESTLGRADSTRGSIINERSIIDPSAGATSERPASQAHDHAAAAAVVAPVALATEAPISHNEHLDHSDVRGSSPLRESTTTTTGPTSNGFAHPEEDRRAETPVRALMTEGQAYRSDGSVPGQAEQPLQQTQGYGGYVAPLAGAGVAGTVAYGLHQHKQQQQQHQQGYQQHQQGYQNDPSFAQERAMSPGPNNFLGAGGQDPTGQMSRLSFQDPAQQMHVQQQQQGYHGANGHGGMNGGIMLPATAAGVGPSPGPPVNALSPTSPLRRTPEPTSDLARNSTMRSTGGLSRGSTLRKGGAFANGSALQGGGVGEAFGRDDIHARTAGADRGLMGAGAAGQAGMHRISKEEARDSKRLSKMIKSEGKTEAAAVKGAIKELESLQKVQRAAHGEELKAQQKHAKFTRVEHKARLRFLKEKERYERVEAQLRSIEADYEAKREHAAQQTELLAEKTQELNDLRAQKAADDRERELKLLALKNPGHA